MYILFDIGGTNMRLAVSRDGVTIDKIKIVPTPQAYKEGVNLFCEISNELVGGKKIKGVAGGVAGPLDRDKTMLVTAPNLQKWNYKPFKKDIEKKLQTSVVLENDAAIVGLGEAVVGAGKNENIVAYITVSTGIGGARIVNCEVDKSAMGFEPGHQILNFDDTSLCGNCGTHGDLESYASGSGIKKRYKKSSKDLTNKKTWKEINLAIAHGLHNVAVFWSPDVIVIGGGMVKNSNLNLQDIKNHLKRTLKIFPKPPKIKKAKLKDVGGLHGALQLLLTSQTIPPHL